MTMDLTAGIKEQPHNYNLQFGGKNKRLTDIENRDISQAQVNS
jgi:hypothetical protein